MDEVINQQPVLIQSPKDRFKNYISAKFAPVVSRFNALDEKKRRIVVVVIALFSMLVLLFIVIAVTVANERRPLPVINLLPKNPLPRYFLRQEEAFQYSSDPEVAKAQKDLEMLEANLKKDDGTNLLRPPAFNFDINFEE